LGDLSVARIAAVPYRDLRDALFAELRGTGLARPRPWRFAWEGDGVRVYRRERWAELTRLAALMQRCVAARVIREEG
jgi:hypothetical protein